MFRVIHRFFDRLIFATGVILFLQLPTFVDQYTQRFGGYYDAEKNHLEKYQDIADKFYDGDLDVMIENFSELDNEAIKETGEQLKESKIKKKELSYGMQILENDPFLYRVAYIFIHFDKTLFFGTIHNYVPGMPFTTTAFICGLVGGLLFSGLFTLIRRIVITFARGFKKK